MTLTYGSLFSGYGGLDMGVQSVLPGRTAWHVEFDRNPSRILAHHWPDVPNYGDVTTVDWENVEPVDVLTGGFPCQDVSHAGRRAGLIRDGDGRTRSGLWGQMLRAIDTLRPRLVVAENVRGLLSAQADSDVEPCPWCMGDAGASPLRALGAVLADLADLGYDASWYGLRAADVGAAHGRFRVFIFAWPADADADSGRPEGAWGGPGGAAVTGLRGESGRMGRDAAGGRPVDAGQVHAGGLGEALGLGPEGYEENLFPTPAARDYKDHMIRREPHRPDAVDTLSRALTLLPTPVSSDANGAGAHGSGGSDLRTIVADHLLPTPRATDGTKGGPNQAGSSGDLMLPSAVQPHRLLPTPMVGSTSPAAHGQISGDYRAKMAEALDRWGDYAPAIARWEHLMGRPAPDPTEPGTKGNPRLSARFVEWLMGLPEGHVTDPAIGISRANQLKALGNGVVPQQAAAATAAWVQDMQAETTP